MQEREKECMMRDESHRVSQKRPIFNKNPLFNVGKIVNTYTHIQNMYIYIKYISLSYGLKIPHSLLFLAITPHFVILLFSTSDLFYVR